MILSLVALAFSGTMAPNAIICSNGKSVPTRYVPFCFIRRIKVRIVIRRKLNHLGAVENILVNCLPKFRRIFRVNVFVEPERTNLRSVLVHLPAELGDDLAAADNRWAVEPPCLDSLADSSVRIISIIANVAQREKPGVTQGPRLAQ